MFSWTTIWAFLGSTLGQIWYLLLPGLVVVGLLYFYKWLLEHKENKWNMYYPYIISGVKIAEKLIKDDTPNKSLAKADLALKEFTRFYEAETGATPNDALLAWAKRARELALIEIEKSKVAATPVAPIVPPTV